MNISGFSNQSLIILWDTIEKAFREDEKSISLGKEPEYGVREFKDWKEWSDRIEHEMRKRELPFKPIPW